jgi:hypothetical protein
MSTKNDYSYLPSWLDLFGSSAGGGQSAGLVNPAQPLVTLDKQGNVRPPAGATNSQTDRKASNAAEEVSVTSNRPTPTTKQSTLSKNQLGIIKFPLDIESSTVPHVLIKIFETQTGAVEVTDTYTKSLISGVDNVIKSTGDLTEAAATVGAATGLYASSGAALLLVLGKKYKAAGTVLGLSGVAGATLGAYSGDIASAVADKGGEIFGIQETANKFKESIKNFALKRNVEQLRLAIALLMPENLAVSYINNYDELSVTGAIGTFGLAAQTLGSKFGSSGDASNPFIMEAAGRLGSNILNEDFKRIGLFATTGRTLNPQPEMIYNSPALREFRMDFRLMPRNQTEAATIRNLINQLKYFAAPQIPENTSGRYFIPPAQFELEFYDAENNQNSYLFKTKKCVLQDITIDYTGSSSGYASFYDGSPVETRLSLVFKETVFINRDDVSKGY